MLQSIYYVLLIVAVLLLQLLFISGGLRWIVDKGGSPDLISETHLKREVQFLNWNFLLYPSWILEAWARIHTYKENMTCEKDYL